MRRKERNSETLRMRRKGENRDGGIKKTGTECVIARGPVGRL